MSDSELEREASRWRIKEYGYGNGTISRKIIIEQLIKKGQANNSRYAIFISIIALITSVLAMIFN